LDNRKVAGCKTLGHVYFNLSQLPHNTGAEFGVLIEQPSELNLETIQRYYRVDRRKIAFLRFIFEAYDGIAGLTTIDPERGIISLHIAPGCENDVEFILQDLKKEILIDEF